MSDLTVPEEMTTEVLREHVNEIVFNSGEALEEACILCQRAAKAGLWDPWFDADIPEEAAQLAELKRRADLLP